MGLLDFGHVFGRMVRSDDRHSPDTVAASGSLMAATRRELAILSADMMGVQSYLGEFGPGPRAHPPTRADRKLFREFIEDRERPFLILDPRRGLHIVDMNDAFAAVSITDRRRAIGRKLFEVFPENPEIPEAEGVGNLYESLKTCAQSGRAHRMPVTRYDIQDPTGKFEKRHWRSMNTPIFDADGRLVFLVNYAEEVTVEC